STDSAPPICARCPAVTPDSVNSHAIDGVRRRMIPRKAEGSSCPAAIGSLAMEKAAEVTAKEGWCGAGTRPKKLPLQKGT
ncbi:hypothetical protein ACFWNU_35780, partial [Streptomyces sp. NPDC058427]|uniref:hypothetical protein n=1 Tax=Streptomyces sp. NPDC058427 TaxID=3346494 RepID=UPI0036491C1A